MSDDIEDTLQRAETLIADWEETYGTSVESWVGVAGVVRDLLAEVKAASAYHQQLQDGQAMIRSLTQELLDVSSKSPDGLTLLQLREVTRERDILLIQISERVEKCEKIITAAQNLYSRRDVIGHQQFMEMLDSVLRGKLDGDGKGGSDLGVRKL